MALCLVVIGASFGALSEQPEKQAVDITSICEFRVSEGSRGKFLDGSVKSTWTYANQGAYIGVHIPDNIDAGWLRVEWMYDPTGFEIIEYDRDMNLLRQRDQTSTFPNIYTMLALRPETRFIQLTMTATEQEVGRIYVYSEGTLPGDVQLWNPPVEKADLMVVSTHQDDELIYLGGTIPYYAVGVGRPTVVVYMANCTRNRRREALDALWEMGVRDYPDFINLRDKRVDSINEGIEIWGGQDNILDVLVQRIRRFRPEVIVTQDLNGEYGHNQHKITARAMQYAIDAAADPSRYPDSYNQYGAWQVKKLYHHLYGENQITMDWLTPLDALGGLSPLQVAQNGMQKHASQLQYYQVVEGGKYDNAKFGLYSTTVGEDVEKNDFFEHIETTAAQIEAGQANPDEVSEAVPADADEVQEEAFETVQADAAQADAVQAEAEQIVASQDDVQGTPAASPGTAAQAGTTRNETGRGGGWVIVVAAAAAAAGVGAYILRRRAARRRYKRRRRR